MAEQYFTADPTCESKQVPCSFVYRGHGLNFMTDAGVFSKYFYSVSDIQN